MRETKKSDIEKSKSLIQILNDVYRRSTTHLYVQKSINKKLTNEVVQVLQEEHPEFRGSTQENIIKELLEEFETELAQIPPVSFLIQLVEEIDQEITKIQKQNDENLTSTRIINSKIDENLADTRSIKRDIDSINISLNSNTEILNQLSQRSENLGILVSNFQVQINDIEDRVVERVKGGLSDQFLTIKELELKLDNMNQKIPTNLISKRDFWGGIIAIAGLLVSTLAALGIVWLMLNSSIDRIERSTSKEIDQIEKGTSEKIDMSNENQKEIINEKTNNLRKDLNDLQDTVDQKLK